MAEDIVQGSAFHHLAVVEHDDLIGHIGDDAEIMGDHQQRHAQFGLEILDQLQDLGLDGDVERRGRLVGNQQAGPADQRHGDHRALAQAPGQLKGIGARRALGIGKAHQPQHFHHQLAGRGTTNIAMQLEGFADLVADGVDRRQRGHRLLEDDRDASAANGAHLGGIAGQLGDVDDAAARIGIGEQNAPAAQDRRRAAADP